MPFDFVNGHDGKTPMFLYVAHYAPHLPLQAPKEYVDKCLDRYREGYDVLRRRRFEKQKQLGIVADTMSLPVYDREFKGASPCVGRADSAAAGKMDKRHGYLRCDG